MTDIFYEIGKGLSDWRITTYWVADLLLVPREFARGIVGKASLTWQNMKMLDAANKSKENKSKEYTSEKQFLSTNLAIKHRRNGDTMRYEAAESFASLPLIANGMSYVAGNIVGIPYRFVKGLADGVRERRHTEAGSV